MSYDKTLLLVDLRASEDCGQGHIAQSVNIPLNELCCDHPLVRRRPAMKFIHLAQDQEEIVCCAGKKLGDGFRQIIHLHSGLAGWVEAGTRLTGRIQND